MILTLFNYPCLKLKHGEHFQGRVATPIIPIITSSM